MDWFNSRLKWEAYSDSSLMAVSQQRMYDAEINDNFRWMAKLLARLCPYTLTSSDHAPPHLQLELSALGQFAEVAHGSLSPDFIWRNMDVLSQPDFPLDGYDSLKDSTLLETFHGKVAKTRGYIAHRRESNQLIIAFSGTSSAWQALYDADMRLVHYPLSDPAGEQGKCAVHAGFWRLYRGIHNDALNALENVLRIHADSSEIVFTGHSMGAVMCYLFVLDVIARMNPSQSIKLALFGCPRFGNAEFAQHWRDVIAQGRVSIEEYSVRCYNDGVPAAPPMWWGYRHLSTTPLYFVHDTLFCIPSAYSEFSLFNYEDGSVGNLSFHPRGGHNYYNGRDMELLLRRMAWVDRYVLKGSDDLATGWEHRYRARVARARGE